jgi:hypothetical protein
MAISWVVVGEDSLQIFHNRNCQEGINHILVGIKSRMNSLSRFKLSFIRFIFEDGG